MSLLACLKRKQHAPAISRFEDADHSQGYYAHGDLEKLGKRNVTDKSTLSHNYLGCYEFFLSRFRDKQFTLMEIGVNEGVSLRMWRDYFPHAQIVGVDINDCTAARADRIAVEMTDASKPATLNALYETYRPHVIVDDASHWWSHQITMFETLFPRLPVGGVYIYEDIHTSFEPLSHEIYGDSPLDAFSYFMMLSYLVAGSGNPSANALYASANAFQKRIFPTISSITIRKHTVIITK